MITARIAEGAYPVAGKVPSVVELSTEFGIAASTAQKALTHLKAEGLIRTEVGLGSFVADGSPQLRLWLRADLAVGRTVGGK